MTITIFRKGFRHPTPRQVPNKGRTDSFSWAAGTGNRKDCHPHPGLHRIQVRNKKGEMSEAVLEIRYRRIRLLPPIGKQKEYPELMLTLLYAQERGTPKGREK